MALPGYVFFDVLDDVSIFLRFPRTDVLRILMGNDQDLRLTGSDCEFAKWLLSYDGCIGFSTVYREEDLIRIVTSPLKNMEGVISRIDMRGQSGQLTVRLNKRNVKRWLGFDLIEKPFDVGSTVTGDESHVNWDIHFHKFEHSHREGQNGFTALPFLLSRPIPPPALTFSKPNDLRCLTNRHIFVFL